MALNPLAYTEKAIGKSLRYQFAAYPFADPGLHERMLRLKIGMPQARRAARVRTT